jgi:hypothetical protein
MKYWIKGRKGLSERKILDTFSVLGYDVSMHDYLWSDANDSSEFTIYYTWNGGDTVHKVFKGLSDERLNTEYKIIERLIELDKEFIELKPDEIVTVPKFDYDDVIYDTHKAYRRAIVTSVDMKKQQYKVKDFNNAEYYIKFVEQEGWDFVRRPVFDEETMITDGANRIYIISIEYQWQRYKVCIDGDDDTFYIDFKEQDNFRRVDFNEPL